MQKTKSFQIEGYDKTIIVKELTPRILVELFDQKKDLSFNTLLDESFLPKTCNLTIDEIQDYSFSELDTIWTHFKEINSIFFHLVHVMGMTKIVDKIRETIMRDFLDLYVSSPKAAIREY